MFRKVFLLLIFIVRSSDARLLYTANVENRNIFEIASDDMTYNEENENEMIQPADLSADLALFVEDESKYKPLHSHIELYNNRHATKSMIELSNPFSNLQLNLGEKYEYEYENEPYIAGFKEDLDKLADQQKTKRTVTEYIKDARFPLNQVIMRIKRDNEDFYETTEQKNMDFFQIIKDKSIITTERNTEDTSKYVHDYANGTTTFWQKEIINIQSSNNTYVKLEKGPLDQFLIPNRKIIIEDTELPDDEEEEYDYEKFKKEYDQQLMDDIKKNKIFNYTEKEVTKQTFKQAVLQMFDMRHSKNCTKKELTQFGIKAIHCLIHDYRYAKNKTNARKMLLRIWLVLRIWLLIYVCFAIPLWCQKGWCCCCFRCKVCFPRKRILFAKKYYAKNSPGILVPKEELQKSIEYEPTEFEQDAYEQFEAAIRHL